MKTLHRSLVCGLLRTAFVTGFAALTASVIMPDTLFSEPRPVTAPRPRYEMAEDNDPTGVRFLKLGNSYRESRNFDMAKLYLTKGLEIIRNRNPYWEAVGYEYLGLLYRDLGDRQMALEYLRTASSMYDRILSMRNNQGSNVALQGLIADIEQGVSRPAQPRYYTPAPVVTPTQPAPLPQSSMSNALPSGYTIFPATLPATSAPSAEEQRLLQDNTRLQEENRQLTQRIADLDERIRRIESGVTDVRAPFVKSVPFSAASADMSDCKRDIEAIARYRESTLWLNGFPPLDFQSVGTRINGGGARAAGTIITGYLKKGESAKIEVNMPAGSYVVVADGCASKARDVDVRIINAQGVVLRSKDIRYSSSSSDIDAPAAEQSSSTSTSSNSSASAGEQTSRSDSSSTPRTTTTSRPRSQSQMSTMEVNETLRNKPSPDREPLARLGWTLEYAGTHTFLVTMYDADAEGAYFCFLLGRK